MDRLRVYNAAGPRSKELKDLRLLLTTPISVITVGSVSLNPQSGNALKRYYFDRASGSSLNSMGLPNRGMAYYEEAVPPFIEKAHTLKKRVRMSVVGSSPQEFHELVRRAFALGIDEVEINTSCPNVWHQGTQATIASIDMRLLRSIASAVHRAAKGRMVDYKVSPYSDPSVLRAAAKILASFSSTRAIVTANTFPNAFSSQTGLAGFGGAGYRSIVLGQVRQFRDILPKNIKVVGLGGISTAAHIREYVAAGAAEVQIGTHYFEHGPSVFKKLAPH